MTMLKTPFTRHWWWVTLLVVALMLILARLGFWQLDRLAERRAANVALAAALAAQPFLVNDHVSEYAGLTPLTVPSDLADRNISAAGVYDFDHQVIVKLQLWGGQTGVRLVTPLVLDRGGAWETAILVDRGWIPESDYIAGNRYINDKPDEIVDGYLALTEALIRQTSSPPEVTESGFEVFRVDIASIQPVMPYQLLPFYLRQNPPENDNAFPLREARQVDLSEGPHLGYAIQWFIFSIGLGIAYVIFVNRSASRG